MNPECSIFDPPKWVRSIRRFLGLHVHDWAHHSDGIIGGGEVIIGNIRHVTGRRHIFYRECRTCGKFNQYYPRQK